MAKAAKRQPSRKAAPPAPKSAIPDAEPLSGNVYDMSAEQIEQDLLTGRHAGLLQEYFGEGTYEELRGLAQEASRRLVRGAPRVLILPGIMGSTLGVPGRFANDTIWVDPFDIARGRLRELALGNGSSRIQALSVIPLAYLLLRLRLRRAGFDADFFPFDWRQSLPELGSALAQAIEREPSGKVSLVAHSMGGLVAQAAWRRAGKRVRRLIMLGTPNYGSFAPVQAVRGVYPLLQRVASLDLVHSIDELARNVFVTLPSLCQLLPWPEVFQSLDLYSAANWPAQRPRPRQELLDLARQVQQQLGPRDDEKFAQIIGVDRTTVVGLRLENGDFIERLSAAGDGTVPVDFARLRDVPAWYVAEDHGDLQNNAAVTRAVIELLDAESTGELPNQWVPSRAGTWELSEATRAAGTPPPRTLADVPLNELRQLTRELAAAPTEVKPVRPPLMAAPPAAAGVAAPPSRHRINNVVVGRSRQFRLDFRMALGSVTQVDSRALVLGVFRDVAPAGAALALDAALGGAVREFTQRRMFNGNVGEIFLFPTGRHPVRADLVAFVGLGTFDRFEDNVLQVAAENTIRTLVRTQVEELAMVLVGSSSGQDIRRCLENLLCGFVRGLKDADVDRHFRGITLCELDPQRYDEIRDEMYRLASTSLFDDVEVTFYEYELPPPVTAFARGRAPSEKDPVYLILREEPHAERMVEGRDVQRVIRFTDERGSRAGRELRYLRASALTAGAKATVISEAQPVESGRLNELLKRLEGERLGPEDMRRFGRDLAEMVLSPVVRELLSGFQDHHLVIVNDAPTSRIPWEALRIGDWAPAVGQGLSRRYLAENLSVAKWMETRQFGEKLDVLLIVNPTEDLPAAAEEGKRVLEIFAGRPEFEATVLKGAEATHAKVLAAFQSGKFDVMHYAGHAFFDEQSRSRSGIICAGGRVLSGAQLAGLSKLPALVFFNACEAGRVRKTPRPQKNELTIQHRVDRNVSLAEAYLRGGVTNYIGTYWPVGDEAARVFAVSFYEQLAAAVPLGVALGKARQQVLQTHSIDWADYIHYGDHGFQLKIG